MMSSAARSAWRVTSCCETSCSWRSRASLTMRSASRFGSRRISRRAFTIQRALPDHLLARLDDPARMLDLLRDRGAHLVEYVVDLLFVHADGVRQRDSLRVVDEVVQLVDQYQDVHGDSPFRYRPSASCKRRATASGTRPETSPPKVAISLTPLEERKLYCGPAIR